MEKSLLIWYDSISRTKTIMPETFSGFDGQIDWIPLVVGIFTITLGLGVGTWLWRKVFLYG